MPSSERLKTREIKIAPSILAADFMNMERELDSIASAELIHVDVMDGHFVPNLTIGPPIVAAIDEVTKRPLDVHLMIESPETYLKDYVQAGAHTLGVHVEACPHLHGTLGMIRDLGARSCAVLNPSTPPDTIEHVLDEVDQILVMTVNPGFGGQKFIHAMLPKIRTIRGWIKDRNLDIDLEVDGGVTLDNIALAASAGANVFVAGTSVFKPPQRDRKGPVEALRKAAQSAFDKD